jgi:hypothetical protein
MRTTLRERPQCRWLARSAGAGGLPVPGHGEGCLFSGVTRLWPILRCTSSSKPRASATDPLARQQRLAELGSDTCSTVRLDDRRTRRPANLPTSAIRRRAGESQGASWPRSSSPRASFIRVSASSSPTLPDPLSVWWRSTISSVQRNNGSKRAGRDQMDSTVLLHLRRQCSASSAPRTGLQSRATSCGRWRCPGRRSLSR